MFALSKFTAYTAKAKSGFVILNTTEYIQSQVSARREGVAASVMQRQNLAFCFLKFVGDL
jgi:hypothetical protein